MRGCRGLSHKPKLSVKNWSRASSQMAREGVGADRKGCTEEQQLVQLNICFGSERSSSAPLTRSPSILTINLNGVGTYRAIHPLVPQTPPPPTPAGLNPAFLPDAPALKQSGPFPPLTLGKTMVCHGKTHRHLKSALEASIYPSHNHPQSRVQHLVAAVSPFWHKQGRKLQFNMQLSQKNAGLCYEREADKCMGI